MDNKIEEMLIRQDAKLSEICRGQKRIERHIEKTDTKLDDHLKESAVTFRSVVPWRHFLWVVAILIGFIGASFTYTTNVNNIVGEHVTDQTPHYYKIDIEEMP